MSRTIKYRIWDKVSKRMIFSHEPKEQEKREYIFLAFGIGFSHWRKEDFSEPMQFTGVFDRLKVGIYEGDVVELEDTVNGTIEYSGAEFIIRTKDSRIGLNDLAPQYIKIIGNIWEWPGLVRSK